MLLYFVAETSDIASSGGFVANDSDYNRVNTVTAAKLCLVDTVAVGLLRSFCSYYIIVS
jgi:hypothetical protein